MMYKIILSTTRETIPVYTTEEARLILDKVNSPQIETDNVIFCFNGSFKKSHFSALVPAHPERDNFQEDDPRKMSLLIEAMKNPELAEKRRKLTESTKMIPAWQQLENE